MKKIFLFTIGIFILGNVFAQKSNLEKVYQAFKLAQDGYRAEKESYVPFIQSLELLIELKIRKIEAGKLIIIYGEESNIDYLNIDKLLEKAKSDLDKSSKHLGNFKYNKYKKRYDILIEKIKNPAYASGRFEYRSYKVKGYEEMKITYPMQKYDRKIGVFEGNSLRLNVRSENGTNFEIGNKDILQTRLSANTNYTISIKNPFGQTVIIYLLID